MIDKDSRKDLLIEFMDFLYGNEYLNGYNTVNNEEEIVEEFLIKLKGE